MLLNFAFLIALIQGTQPDLNTLKTQLAFQPDAVAQQFYHYQALPANKGSAQFYQLTLRAAILSNQPKLANDIALKLADSSWETIIPNRHAKLLSNLGVLLRINGHYKQAQLAYDCALLLNKNDDFFQFHTLLNLQSAMVHNDEHELAQKTLEKAQQLAVTESQNQRIKVNLANNYLDSGQLNQAKPLYKALFRDASLAKQTESAARIGLNLLNTVLLLKEYDQFWRYQNSVKENIFAIKGNNHHYFYHLVLMRTLVSALQAPNQTQYERFSYALEHGEFLFEYGQKQSMALYVDMLNVPWIREQFVKQLAEYARIKPQKEVSMQLYKRFCPFK